MEFSKACTDVSFILENMQKKEVNKIPKKIIDLISILKLDDYKSTIDIDKPLEEQDISETTKELISFIYNEYLGTEEEKEQYEKKYNNYLHIGDVKDVQGN